MSHPQIALLGNPNCGKTTLFNAMTGGRQHVGNWPGVTVERKTGTFCENTLDVDVIDLPGTYSLTSITAEQSIDERIACETILEGKVDLLVNVIDATNLERHLYLTSQALTMGVPMIIVVNMVDRLTRKGKKLDVVAMEQALGCPVVPVAANKKQGITELKQHIVQELAVAKAPTVDFAFTDAVNTAQQAVVDVLPATTSHKEAIALLLLEGDTALQQKLDADVQTRVNAELQTIENNAGEEADILIADARFNWAHNVAKQAITTESTLTDHSSVSHKIDDVVLHRIWGIPIFLLAMYTMFLFAINVGGALQDLFDLSSSAIFVTGVSKLLSALHCPAWLTAVIADGAGRGINTTVTFVPVIGAMFFFLALLESSGYMARAAFVVDRLMRVLGLPGKSFVPMIVGFGCNVPAIMAARTLENPRDRVLTIMMSPFMSCGARLAIFAVFTAAFFPVGGHNVVFALYMIGITMAVVTGLVLRKTVLQGKPSPLVMEIPPYHRPKMSVLLRQTWFRLKNFLLKAGKVIVPVCMIIGTLNAVHVGNTSSQQDESHSLLSIVGQTITPVFKPMGIEQNNWPATVGLVTGVLAKEVVVATLNTLYTQVGHLSAQAAEQSSVVDGLQAAVLSVPQNVAGLTQSLTNPVLASAPEQETNSGVYGVMYKRFGGPIAAFSYLLFVLLYVPCISATAAMVRELNKRWAIFSVLWTTGVAYGAAVVFYQLATINLHMVSSLSWVLAIALTITTTIMVMRRYATGNMTLKIVS